MSDGVAEPGWRPEPAPSDGFWTVHQGDARDIDALLRLGSRASGSAGEAYLQATITSPPYGTLVDYGGAGQIGFGQSYEAYLDSCTSIFESLYNWTLDTGSMWVVADSMLERRTRKGNVSRLLPLPFTLAERAESVGWTLREVIIWRKDRTRPWSHHGKLRNGFEYVLLFVKTDKFLFNVDRLRETGGIKSWWVKYPERHNPWGMIPDNVWEIPIPVQGSWDGSAFRHACPFPPDLVRRMVLLSSNEGDVVFDPFAGSGSVVRGAAALGRRAFGNELNSDYVASFRKEPRGRAPAEPAAEAVGAMTQRLLELRMLKYPKELSKQLLRAGFTTEQIRAIALRIESVNYQPARTGYGDIACSVIVSDGLSEIECARLSKVMEDVSSKPPLSKYGLSAQLNLVPESQAGSLFQSEPFSAYTRGRTWYADEKMCGDELQNWLKRIGRQSVVPIISPLHVRQSLEESL